MNDSNKWERLRAILEKEYGDWAFSVNSDAGQGRLQGLNLALVAMSDLDEEQAKTRVEQENNPCFW